MAIYIPYKFHEIPSIGYLVMDEDGKSEKQKDGWTMPNQYHSPLAVNKLGINLDSAGQRAEGKYYYHKFILT